jgi:hypothetical protein
MIKKGKVPISGGAGQFRKTPNVLSNAADTSRDGQKLVKGSPMPMQSRNGPMNVAAGVHEGFAKAQRFYGSTSSNLLPRNSSKSQPQTSFSIHKGTKHSASEMAAVGYEPRATMSRNNSIISGHPTKNVSRTVGAGNFPKATASQRSKYPGIFGSTKYRP